MASDQASDVTAAVSDTSEGRLTASPWTQLAGFAAVFVASWITIGSLGASDRSGAVWALLASDRTGIITAQFSAAMGFLAILILQTSASRAEAETRFRAAPVRPFLLRAAGLPPDWPGTLVQERLARDDLETALSQHAEARLGFARVILAGFPTSGFIGTVIGIREAIAPLDDLASQVDPGALSEQLGQVVSGLELAFDTTLVGLVLLLLGSFAYGATASYLRRIHTALLLPR